MKNSPRFDLGVVTMVLITATPAFCQSYSELVFNQPVQATNANHSQLGDYYTGTTYDFLDVIPALGGAVDMRLTVGSISSPRYSHNGTLPNYSEAAGEPGGDLGYLFSYTGGAGTGGNFGEGGVTYQLDFFSGGSNFTDPYSIPDFRLMIYDIDGEPSQGESLLVYADDGLVSYRLSHSTDLAVSLGEDGNYRFTGPNALRDESDPRASVILNYSNTSSVRLRMLADTYSNSPNNNGVFGGIDGDLSLIGSDSFASPIMAVPEPSVALLAMFGMVPLLRRRR